MARLERLTVQVASDVRAEIERASDERECSVATVKRQASVLTHGRPIMKAAARGERPAQPNPASERPRGPGFDKKAEKTTAASRKFSPSQAPLAGTGFRDLRNV